MAAALYCMENYLDEVIWENGRLQEITVYGKRSLKKRLH